MHIKARRRVIFSADVLRCWHYFSPFFFFNFPTTDKGSPENLWSLKNYARPTLSEAPPNAVFNVSPGWWKINRAPSRLFSKNRKKVNLGSFKNASPLEQWPINFEKNGKMIAARKSRFLIAEMRLFIAKRRFSISLGSVSRNALRLYCNIRCECLILTQYSVCALYGMV